MESIIKEAISRAGESPMPVIGDTDKELLEILQELKTNIVVIGVVVQAQTPSRGCLKKE